MGTEKEGNRRRGKPKRRCLDIVRTDFKEKGLSGSRKCMTERHGGECQIISTST